MTKKEFMKKIGRTKKDLLEGFVGILKDKKISYCLVGGLAVNAYAEPVVSLDLDVVVIVDKLEGLLSSLAKGHKIERYANSVNISSRFSDLRIQIQTDPRYQDFIKRAVYKEVLGYKLPVAGIEDVLQGKIWAAEDGTRRLSKRQKDFADIARLVETKKELLSLVPPLLREKIGL